MDNSPNDDERPPDVKIEITANQDFLEGLSGKAKRADGTDFEPCNCAKIMAIVCFKRRIIEKMSSHIFDKLNDIFTKHDWHEGDMPVVVANEVAHLTNSMIQTTTVTELVMEQILEAAQAEIDATCPNKKHRDQILSKLSDDDQRLAKLFGEDVPNQDK